MSPLRTSSFSINSPTQDSVSISMYVNGCPFLVRNSLSARVRAELLVPKRMTFPSPSSIINRRRATKAPMRISPSSVSLVISDSTFSRASSRTAPSFVTRAVRSDRPPEITDISPVNCPGSRTARIFSSSPALLIETVPSRTTKRGTSGQEGS